MRLNTAQGVVEFKGATGEFLGASQQVAAFIATAGPNVEALASEMMSPLKSVSGLIGLGPPEDIQQYGSPCDRCELSNCDMRRNVSQV